VLLIAQLIETFIFSEPLNKQEPWRFFNDLSIKKKRKTFLHDFFEKKFLVRPSCKYKDFILFLFERLLLLTKMLVHTCVILLILATTLTQLRSEHIKLKGNLHFTELGGKCLNQEYVIFMRSLNTSDLRLLATYLQQSVNLYHSFGDQIKTTLGLTKNKMEQFHRGPKCSNRYTRSNSKHQLRDAPAICRYHNFRLSEVRIITDLQDLQDFQNGTGTWRVMAGIHYNKP